jgi:tRNA(fMet)-specific endonuclease VapC
MNLFVLDTDILSLLQASHAAVSARVAARDPAAVVITVISVDEQLRGWYTLVRKAKTPAQVAFAYDRLARNVSFLSRTNVISFPEAAVSIFESLKKAKLGVGGNDLRIAAIALHTGATVITRNVRDFERVPGLKIEDWSKQ